ncbi:MAG TPA: pectate lyase, partial [Bacillota bacterium]|nr:pectate lyase [Bacillota bacterium]
SMRYVSNIIIQNMKIHHVKASDDCIGIEGPANNIWVDHCELYNDLNHDKDYYDGLLDAKSSAQYITVSWTYFHDSYKTSLNGSSDSDNFDRKVTYHHNYFKNCNSRLPLYRFGTGHVFNNYYSDVPTSGVNSRMGAKLRVEGNYFERVNNPICSLDSSEVGFWDVKNNTFVDCTGNQPTSSNCSFNPPYSYTLESPETAKAKVLAGVGVGKI